MRIVFAGTPEIAATVLAALLQSGHEIVAAYTQPDRPAGRGRCLTASPVKILAQAHHIPIEQPASLSAPKAQEVLAAYQADLMVVVAYGLLLPQTILDTPSLGCWNVHVSLLPRWRGAAPIQRAIQAGDRETGVSIMQMDAGLDTGSILLQRVCEILPDDTGGALHDRLAQLGAQALIETLDLLACDQLSPQPQSITGATYAHKLKKSEAVLDWSAASQVLCNQVRAFNPWPVAITSLGANTLRVWVAKKWDQKTQQAPGTIIAASAEGIDVACGEGVLRILQCQLPGKKILTARDIVNQQNHPFVIGRQFDVSSSDKNQ